MNGQLLGGIGQLVGGASGLFGRSNKPPTISEQVIGQAEGARKAAELYGFNRLALLGLSTSPMQPGPQAADYMGSAIADGAMMLAEGLSKRRGGGQLSILQQANQKLQRQVARGSTSRLTSELGV